MNLKIDNFSNNNNWVNLLSDHEYRHLVQREVGYTSFFNRAVHYLFGQGVSSLLTRSSMPNWYWEGDAVDIETRVGDFGRGRIPKFNLITRMNKQSGVKLKYNRQTLGSFKYKTPNEYEVGYLMVNSLWMEIISSTNNSNVSARITSLDIIILKT